MLGHRLVALFERNRRHSLIGGSVSLEVAWRSHFFFSFNFLWLRWTLLMICKIVWLPKPLPFSWGSRINAVWDAQCWVLTQRIFSSQGPLSSAVSLLKLVIQDFLFCGSHVNPARSSGSLFLLPEDTAWKWSHTSPSPCQTRCHASQHQENGQNLWNYMQVWVKCFLL